ncbi:MAG: hypothetical protein R2795_11900 [Saprospiraceae bacterium]
MTRFLLFSALLFSHFIVSAQIHDRLHWVFPADSVQKVVIEVVDPYTISNWDGHQVMVASEITVYNASQGIMDFFIKENKRYEVVDTIIQQVMTLDSYQSRRAPIQSKGMTCYEQVQVKIFLPFDFQQESDTVWVRRKEE